MTQRQNNNLGLTENFYYDSLYRLDYSTLGGTTNLDLSYDAMGNITSRSDIAGGAAWTYDPTKKHAVRQAGSASYTYTYDANGNAQTRNGYGITWTSYNYPSVINGPNKTLTFSYGPDRQRYKQVYSNGSTIETTMYIGGALEKVTAAGVTDWRHYISAGGQTVAIVSRQSSGTNTTRYVLEDHQGSVAQIIDSAGASYVSESFTAFGARRDASTWSDSCNCTDLGKMKSVTRRGYTGHEAVGGVSMGLNHMNGRVQDAITGRFLSADPYITESTNTQGFNRYSYVMNNPLSYADPSGFTKAPIKWINANEPPIETVVVSASFISGSSISNYAAALHSSNIRVGAPDGMGGRGGTIETVTSTATRIKPRATVVASTVSEVEEVVVKADKCWNGSLGIGAVVHGPVAGPVGIGVSGGPSVGFSYGGHLARFTILFPSTSRRNGWRWSIWWRRCECSGWTRNSAVWHDHDNIVAFRTQLGCGRWGQRSIRCPPRWWRSGWRIPRAYSGWANWSCRWSCSGNWCRNDNYDRQSDRARDASGAIALIGRGLKFVQL